MIDMICSICHRYGIYWKNLSGICPYTFCPNCHNKNCAVIYEDTSDTDDMEDVKGSI
jgi:hypothetical protein